MLGEKSANMWLNQFKVALIEEDIDKMSELLDTMPQFETIKELEEAKYLIANAFDDALTQKNKISIILSEIKKKSSFLKSGYDAKSHKLNITS